MFMQERRSSPAPAGGAVVSRSAAQPETVPAPQHDPWFEHDFTRVPAQARAEDTESAGAGDVEASAEEEPGPGHPGERIVYGDFRDRINVFFARLTNRAFRTRFSEWRDSPDRYVIQRDRKAKDLLIDAEPVQVGATFDKGTADEHEHFTVKYRRAGLDADPPALDRSLPSFRRGKGDDRGWGMANRFEQPNGFHVLSFGVGDYNDYNMLGGEQTGKRIRPYTNALIAFVGRSKCGRPPAFIAIGVGLRKAGGWVSTPQSRKRWRNRWRRRLRRLTGR